MLRLVHVLHWHLVRTPVAFGALAVHLFRAGPAFGGSHHDHGPLRAVRVAVNSRVVLDGADLLDDGIQGRCHQLVHGIRVVALHEIGLIAVAPEEAVKLLVADAGQYGGIGDFVAVQVQYRQDGAIVGRIEKLVAMPRSRQGAGFGLAVADHAADQHIRIVEGCPIGVRQGVAQLAPLMNGAGRLRCNVAGNAAGKRELAEQLLHALGVLRDIGIELAVGPFQIGAGDEAGAAVSRAGDIDRVDVVLLDDAVEVNVDEVEAGRGAPVAQQARLDVFALQRLPEERIVQQIDLAYGKVIGGPPVGVHLVKFVGAQRLLLT